MEVLKEGAQRQLFFLLCSIRAVNIYVQVDKKQSKQPTIFFKVATFVLFWVLLLLIYIIALVLKSIHQTKYFLS